MLGGLVAVILSGGDDPPAGPSATTATTPTSRRTAASSRATNATTARGPSRPTIQFGDLEESAKQAGCELHLDLEDEGNTHFTDENQGDYKTNPPTSGDHYGVSDEPGSGALADGAYLTTPPESRLVHAMEHGRIEIRYDPELPDDQQLALKGVFDQDPGGIIMLPDPDLPYAVAVSAWTQLRRLQAVRSAGHSTCSRTSATPTAATGPRTSSSRRPGDVGPDAGC